MIFSKFFKSTWQNKDSNIRISAINNELDINNSEQNAILLSLLANDDNELVRRAVLIKLNNFDAWLNASNDNNNKKVRDYAVQQVEDIVLSQHQIKLTPEQKSTFLQTSVKASLLESWLKVETDTAIIIEIFDKLAKPQLLVSTFHSHASIDVQTALLLKVENKDQLEKLLKKSTIEQITNEITAKIAQLIEVEEKPKKITKQTQLILAKYLALKDVKFYQEYTDKKALLEQDWQTVLNEFNYFTDDVSRTFIQKHDDISLQLAKVFAQKAEAFEQEKIANKLVEDKAIVINETEQTLLAYKQQLTTYIFENKTIDEQAFNQQLQLEIDKISSSVLDESNKNKYLSEIKQLQDKLSKLPEIAESVTQATHLISKISQLSVPENLTHLTERESSYQDWLTQWHKVSNKASGALPESIVSSYHEIVKVWNKALKPLHAKQSQQFNQVQRKLADVKRLINTGKYNAAFGVYKKADLGFEQLSHHQQQRLQRDHSFAKEKIAELSDWEHYIATPRKQELIDKINELAENPLDNPSEQATKVKAYRQQWNLLGHADDDVEQSFNHDFNEACEKAFAPCRLFYAEQDKMREQHLATRMNLISLAKTFANVLSNDEINWKSIDAEINQFKQKWQDAGEVERGKYQALNGEFNQALKPVKEAIYQYHQENIDIKQRIINQAEQLLKDENVDLAVAEIKKLQAKWRDIGHCGSRDENRLWRTFRKVNDQVFGQRENQQNENKALEASLIDGYMKDLDVIEQGIVENTSLKTLKEALNALSFEHTKVKSEKITLKSVSARIENMTKKFNAEVNTAKKMQKQLVWQQVFAVLTDSVDAVLSEQEAFQLLPNQWQKKLSGLSDASASFEQRQAKTITMEILAGVESPEEEKDQRLAIQIEIMQSKLSLGKHLDIEENFVEWLNLGKLTKQDLPLLSRIETLFVK